MAIFDKVSALSILVLALTLGYAGGFWIAYSLIIVTVSVTIAQAIRRRNLWIAGDRAGQLFFIGFVLLAIAFLINRDVVHIANFLVFLLFAPLSSFLSRFAAPRNAFWVAIMANLGCGVGFVVACYQVIWLHSPRASAFGSDPIWSAQAGVIIAYIALLGLMTTDRPWRVLFILGPAVMMIAIILSGSRGPMLALPILFVVFTLLGTRRWWLSIAVTLAMATLALLLSAWFWPEGLQRMWSLQTMVTELLSKGQISDFAAGERQLMYEAGIKAFMASPLFGYGWENVVTAILPYLPNGLASFQSIHHHLHNDGLDFAVAGGLLGLIAYGLILLAPIMGAAAAKDDRQRRFRYAANVGLTTAYAVFGLSYLTFGYEYHTTLYVCLAAILGGFCRDSTLASSGKRSFGKYLQSAGTTQA